MDISNILTKLERDKGLVLKDYRDGTLVRRIERRMKYDGAGSLDEYIQMIDGDHRLYWRLVSDLFIGVTDFFRDPEVWRAVEESVLPELVSRTRCEIRIWSAGCSTGEETWSLAIMMNEFLKKHASRDTRYEIRDARYEMRDTRCEIRVLGTDIMEDKLEVARKGVYGEDKVVKVEENLKNRYFSRLPFVDQTTADEIRDTKYERRDTRYEIRDTLRKMAAFRQFDLVRPKPMPLFDMIVCRNVLIYFRPHLQEQVIGLFHSSLKPGGILWLGMTETLWGEAQKLFEPVCLRERVYRRQ